MKKFFIAFLITASVFIFLLKSDKQISSIVSPSSEETPVSDEITLISTGDIGLVRDINYKIILEKNPNFPFLKIAEYLKDSDLAGQMLNKNL